MKFVCVGGYGSCLAARLAVDEYWSAMALHRQAEALERLGLSMPSSTMADQIQWACP